MPTRTARPPAALSIAAITLVTASSRLNDRSRSEPWPGRSTVMQRYRSESASTCGCQTDRPIIAPWTNTIGGAVCGPATVQGSIGSWSPGFVIGRFVTDDPDGSARLGADLPARFPHADRGGRHAHLPESLRP